MSRHASSLPSSAVPAGVSYRLRGFLTRHRWLLGGLALLVIVAVLLMQLGVMRGLSLQILAWQRDLHRALTLAVGGWSETPSWVTAGWLLALSFGYGVFHAAGPGHGKAVLSTYLVSQGGGLKRALGLSFSAALLQGMMAIAMVLMLVQGLGWLTRRAMGSVASLELASFLMVALLGAWLCLRAWRFCGSGPRWPGRSAARRRADCRCCRDAAVACPGRQAPRAGAATRHGRNLDAWPMTAG